LRTPSRYAGIALFLIFSALALNSWWGLVPNGLVALTTIVRTALEDKFLQENLKGYRAYAQRVRYRVLPGIW
jgi:protein-S-isoprenylcysteine O-methyltransferase Ste14